MATTQQLVKKHTEEHPKKQKGQFDKKAKASKISVGDKVLVKILAYEGKHKIADKFEEDVYRVVEQPRHDMPVFKVRSSEGAERLCIGITYYLWKLRIQKKK